MSTVSSARLCGLLTVYGIAGRLKTIPLYLSVENGRAHIRRDLLIEADDNNAETIRVYYNQSHGTKDGGSCSQTTDSLLLAKLPRFNEKAIQ